MTLAWLGSSSGNFRLGGKVNGTRQNEKMRKFISTMIHASNGWDVSLGAQKAGGLQLQKTVKKKGTCNLHTDPFPGCSCTGAV